MLLLQPTHPASSFCFSSPSLHLSIRPSLPLRSQSLRSPAMESQHVINPWQHRTHKESMHQAGVTHLELESSSAFDGLFQDPKEVFYHSQRLLQHLQARQQQHKDNMHDHGYSRESEDDETGSQDTAWSRLGMDSPLCQSSSTLGDPAPVAYSLESGVEPEVRHTNCMRVQRCT